MVTRYSRELVIKMFARFKCSKSASTTVLSEITCLLWITENLWDAFWDTKGFKDGLGYLPFSDLGLLDMVKLGRW